MSVEFPPTIQEILLEVLDVLDAAGYGAAVVGALATFAWGDPRTTRDVDLAVHASLEEADDVADALRDAGFEPEGPLSTAFGPRLLLVTDLGVHVDLFLEPEPGLFDRAGHVDLAGKRVPVSSPEDVIARKLHAADRFPEERERDLEDASGVLFKQWGTLDEGLLERLCDERGTVDLLEALAEEVEEARGEHGLET